ncbi:ABC transporter ATP-binding protein [Chachezhania antarctica]|uniref:ABC transporter ATP-binding protein n=1 Tax=Chachezhania antarctica TaxID=2340860 RepID=UPI000EAD01A1|nr:ABC transporter ATP-binding protein [Chachezhania antarctica]|tara:strand:+ start:5000 stop:6010 length:1011 start_codon:yes stop_codon:yes gene_type:complete
MSADDILRVNGLKVHFDVGRKPGGARRVVHAVDGVDFHVTKGTCFGIVGESGSGKSTIAQAIMRLAPITDGSVFLGNQQISGLQGDSLRAARQRFQMVFQDPFSSLNPRKKARAAIREPLDLLEIGTPSERDAVAEEMLTAVGLHRDAGRLFPHQFSGGQRQRLCIARALASRPDLIVCDEPVSALDVAIQAQILNLLRQLQADMGLSYVFISHDLAVVQYICDDVGVMYLGEFVEQAPVGKLFQDAKHPYTWSLMAAALSPEAERGALAKRPLLGGEPPSPTDPPSGCRFAARCPFATDKCVAEKPALRDFGSGHRVACHFAGELEPPIPELRAA